ncbi:MAG TPA: tripartite tricarboxylate transporter substrate-binding protein, partial [Xanthobacteraceae bacterium]|nr:tripartite tricarboxylate transporter substrate-binding protein [Xanthobacteraceae bacterium]
MKCFRVWLLACLAVLAANALTRARAEDYPARALRVITANSAGGTSDIFVRALAEKLQARLGQPVIVENRPGGAMIIAGRACADAANDGYTICLLPNETLTLNQFTYKSISYDPEKDFAPITNAFINTQVMVVSSALNVASLDELAQVSEGKARDFELQRACHSDADHGRELEEENRRRSRLCRGSRRRRHGERSAHDAGRHRRAAELHSLHPHRH